MRSILLNYRFWILSVLVGCATICLLSEPGTEDVISWCLVLIVSKAIGAFFAWIALRLFRYWAKRGKINELIKYIGE